MIKRSAVFFIVVVFLFTFGCEKPGTKGGEEPGRKGEAAEEGGEEKKNRKIRVSLFKYSLFNILI